MAGPANIDSATCSEDAEHVLVCKGCKFGCVITLTLDERGGIASLKGNTCERGVEYAERKVAAGALGEATEPASETAKAPAPPAMGYREFRRHHRQGRAQSR